MTSTLAPDGDGVKIRSFLIIITQSDTKNTEYLISCLQIISLEQLLLSNLVIFKDWCLSLLAAPNIRFRKISRWIYIPVKTADEMSVKKENVSSWC